MSTFICVGENHFNLDDGNNPNLSDSKRIKFVRKLRDVLNTNTTGYSRCIKCGTKRTRKDFCIMCRQQLWPIKTKYIIRLNLNDLQKGKCCYCGTKVPFDQQTLEHIQPKSMGGEDIFANLAMSCKPCNNKRGNRDINLVMNYPISYNIIRPKTGVTPTVHKGTLASLKND